MTAPSVVSIHSAHMLTAVQSLRRSISNAPCAIALAFGLLAIVAAACMTHSANSDRAHRAELSPASVRLTNVILASYETEAGSGGVRSAPDAGGSTPLAGGDASSEVVEVFEDADGEDFDRRARGAAVGSALLHSSCDDAPFADSLRSLREDRRRTRPPNV